MPGRSLGAAALHVPQEGRPALRSPPAISDCAGMKELLPPQQRADAFFAKVHPNPARSSASPASAAVDNAGAPAAEVGVAACTVMLAEAVPPATVSFEVTGLVVFIFVPGVEPVTFAEKVHELSAPNVAPVRLTEPDPAVAVMLPPPQEPVNPLGVATAKPAGKVSAKPTPLSGPSTFGLAIVKLKLVVPPVGMVAAPKALLMVGGFGVVTVILAVAEPPNTSVSKLIVLVVLTFNPAGVPVTFTEKIQPLLALNVASDKLTEPDPAVAVMAPPPQVPLRPLGVDTTRPAGRLSVKFIALCGPASSTLLIVKVKPVVPPTGMLATSNALLMVTD